MSITKQQIITIQSIINTNPNLKEAKEDLIMDASGGRTISVKELTFQEASGIISALKNSQTTFKKEVNKADPCHKMRGKILSHAHELGWHKKDAQGNLIRDPTTNKPKIDFDRVNEWCVKYGYLHKKLDKYTYEELTKLVWQFKEAYKGYLKQF